MRSIHASLLQRGNLYNRWIRRHSQRSLGRSQFDQNSIASAVRSVSSSPCFSLLGSCHDIRSLEKVHGLLIVRGLTGHLPFDTKLVSLYGGFGSVGLARLVFDRIPDPDLYSWKVMLRRYSLDGCHPEVVRLYWWMRGSVKENDNVVFSIVLKACSELRDKDRGRKVHGHVVKAGSPDSFVFTGLVDMYAKCGDVECSRQAFDENVDRNVVSWTSMIVGYVQNGCAEEALALFNRMREELVVGNQFTVGSLVTACSKLGALHQGKWFHGYLIKNGIELNSFLVTALLDMYAKCGEIIDAETVFDELSSTDLVSWTAMIVGYTQSGHAYMALKLFTNEKWASLMPNSVTVASVLSACAQLGNSNVGMSVHGLGIKIGLEESTVKNALLDMYAKSQRMEDACCIFNSVSEKDLIAWNSLISGFVQNGSADKALELFRQMRSESLSPDAVTLVVVLSASAFLAVLAVGSSLHAYSIKKGLSSSNVHVGTALLNFYAKCGDVESARRVFDAMDSKNTVTWSAMIGGYGIHGDGSGSLTLFSDMLKEEIRPTEVIFTSILSACRHTGLVGEGWRYFNSMCQDYNFVPSMKHYACMIDLLSRAGRLEEALEFIEKMPMQPDISLFGAFLHGCGLYSRHDLGEVAIKRMLELHPKEACYYVLMSNLSASDGRWSRVNYFTELMEEKGLKKSPGCSMVEMDAGDKFSAVRVATV
ncbi:hypothetical protein ACJRO7_012398 [Eucalyptus globulus]|uniref:Pentatricopeptide repeat-containing protein n=1 Tax=Eucalyptus globulus TaxID=34317 RepID=A0ABD3LLX0_EUCGL